MTTDGPTRVSPAAANPARPAEAASATPVSRFRWPLDGAPRLVRRFDPPPQPWSPGHRGVDLAAPPGAVVRAAGDGVVLFVGRIAGRGVVSVQHAGGLRSTYEPVGSGVTAGARVTAGAPLGVLAAGHPGCPAPACLHWGLRRGASYLDPLFLLGLGRVRLLPLSAARRAVGAGAGPAAHSRRRGCRPGRRGGASPDRPTR
ncbi:peptidoglycan DD-metalloendopeptidase family protein [Micromonospora sp. NPDC049679]|uniref:murein hydrolase activator EnvC family protein n=1 Tax=Micromonospora sp. NPDC049679 TaxID=3155920 RepID=UPI0033F068ED